MNLSDELAARRAIAAVPASSLPDLIVTVLDRIGGHRALIQAVAETQNARAARQRRRRCCVGSQRELRA